MKQLEAWVLAYLLNSLWQLPLVFAAMGLVVPAVRRLGRHEEHRLWCGGLILATLLPACDVDGRPLVAELWRALTGWFAHRPVVGATVTVSLSDGHAARALHAPAHWLDAVLVLYALIVGYFAARLVWGLWQTHRLRRQATAVPLDGRVGVAWHRHAQRFGVLATDLATVPDAMGTLGPMTVGVSRRMLLLPETWLDKVDAEDLDAAIAHECAHMQRRDFAKNLLCRILTLPVSYHPALWLMHSRVVETREMICDAMAADAVAGRERYARSLLRLAANFVHGSRGPNLHAIGIFDANNFERRVMNLTMNRMNTGAVRRVATYTLCAMLGLGTTVSALALRTQVAVPAVPPAASPAQQSAALPAQMVLAVPRSETGEPAKSFRIVTWSRLREPVAEPDQTASAAETPADAPHVSASVMAGNILTKVNPVYPQAAKDAKIQGAVVLDAVIGKDGALKSLKLVSGPEELAHSAWTAVAQWTYKPYLLNGNPTEVETTITVNYTLNP
jgi:TonB family protein